MNQPQPELNGIINDSFKKLKEFFYQNYKFEEREEDNYPPLLTLRDIIESLPPAIQVIEIVGPQNHKTLKNGKGFILKFDFEYLNSDKIEYCGSIDYNEPDKLVSILVEKCKLKENNMRNYAHDICTNFQLTGMWEPKESWYLHFIQDDILKNPKALDRSLRQVFLFFPNPPVVLEKFKRRFHDDYTQIYGLKPNPILPFEQLLKADVRSKSFNFDLEDLQKKVANIQLIPLVPLEVKTVFNRAKHLFIFGYFQYEFFTISQHYAFLALESAVKHRYIKSLGKDVLLTDKKNPTLLKKLISPTFHFIESFCIRIKGWNRSTLLVNGKAFPYTGKKLIDWLETNNLIRKWERGSYDTALFLRHSHSHLERPSIMIPDSLALERTAEQINFLFHSKL